MTSTKDSKDAGTKPVPSELFSLRELEQNIATISDREIRKRLIQCILRVTMWCKNNKTTLDYGLEQIMQQVDPGHYNRVLEQLKHPEVVSLIEPLEKDPNLQLRIKDSRDVLKAAMDYCNTWYNGYSDFVPSRLYEDKEHLEELLKYYGTMENLVLGVYMDLYCNCPYSTTVN